MDCRINDTAASSTPSAAIHPSSFEISRDRAARAGRWLESETVEAEDVRVVLGQQLSFKSVQHTEGMDNLMCQGTS